jgi:DNA-binding FrmR family transcriptional regulator
MYYRGLSYLWGSSMSHTTKDKKKLLSRIRRIKGQSEAIERALEGEGECEEILQLVASCRGALNGLMAELIEGHLRCRRIDGCGQEIFELNLQISKAVFPYSRPHFNSARGFVRIMMK